MRVVRLVKIGTKWERLPVAKTPTGLDWQKVVHKGLPLVATAGTFYLEYVEDGRKVRRTVGATVREAKQALATQTAVLDLRKQDVGVEDAPEIRASRPVNGPRLSEVVARFIKQPPIHLRQRSVAKYKEALNSFKQWTPKTHLSELERQDILDFMAHLVRVEELSMSTAVDKAIIVLKAMRAAGAAIEMKKGDWPKITKKQPEIYTPEQLKPLFAAMKPDEFVLYQTFLLTGFRDQEVGFLSWPDFNEKAGTLSVTKKAGYNFDPKNYKERTIPIPKSLGALLKKHKAKQKAGEYFIFATSTRNTSRGAQGGQRDRHMLAKLKKIAVRAGLNCGRCHGMWEKKPSSCATKPMCGRWTLHKFRHTYATTLLHLGFDILSVQKLLGHDDIESTMKYLRAMKEGNLAAKINASTLSTIFV